MRISVALALFFIISVHNCIAQYYLRGQIKNEKGEVLIGVKIYLFSHPNYSYASGSTGSFGLPTHLEVDTITLIHNGYETLKQAVATKNFHQLTMKMTTATASLMKNKLSSKTTNLIKEQHSFFNVNGESYSSLIENDFIATEKYPETGFALNIDRASYSNIRRFINNDVVPPRDAVRIEEMLNYFDFKPKAETPSQHQFLFHQNLTTCPWDAKNKLLFLQLTAPKLNLDTIPATNLVFLIDISGSMDKPNRLPLLQTGFKMLVENLREKDKVSIVVYGGGVYTILNPTKGNEKEKIFEAIDSLSAAGDTPGEAAIQTAYSVAQEAYIKGGNNRVILATDGDFNVGQTSEKALEELIAGYANSNIYLTCLGVGMGNYKDSKLEALAHKGKGNFAYIDNVYEARKVLVTEFTKTLYCVANDAWFNINFDKKSVKNYRLIGFDNKKAAIQDSDSELEGGEVGSGHSLLAIFEIETQDNNNETLSLGNAVLQYKLPNSLKTITNNYTLQNIGQSFANADSILKFATSVAMFGSLIKQSKFVKNYGFNDVYQLASTSANTKDFAQQEFLKLMQKAQKLFNYKKKEKR